MIATVRDRLDGVPSLTGRVQGAAALAHLTRSGVSFQGDRAAFVLPLGLRAGEADILTGLVRQPLDRMVGVVLMVRNLADGTGEQALAELEPIVDDVIARIVGWGPSDFAQFTLARGELVSIDAGVITFQLDFGLADQLRIATA